jgi:hypothetical protein
VKLENYSREVWPLLFTLSAFMVAFFGKRVGIQPTWQGFLVVVLFGVGVWLTVRNQIHRTVDTKFDEETRQFIREAAQKNLPTCRFEKPNQERCKRRVARGQKFCWQHVRGLRAKWHSLTRNQTIAFYIGVASLAATLWFGIPGLLPKTTAPTVHVQSSGDQSPNVVDNKGKVEIQNQQSATSEPKSEPDGTGPKKNSKSAAEPKQ